MNFNGDFTDFTEYFRDFTDFTEYFRDFTDFTEYFRHFTDFSRNVSRISRKIQVSGKVYEIAVGGGPLGLAPEYYCGERGHVRMRVVTHDRRIIYMYTAGRCSCTHLRRCCVNISSNNGDSSLPFAHNNDVGSTVTPR